MRVSCELMTYFHLYFDTSLVCPFWSMIHCFVFCAVMWCDMICSHKNDVWISDGIVHHHTVLCSVVTSWHVPMSAFVILVLFRCHTIACCWSQYLQRNWIKFKSCVTSKVASPQKLRQLKSCVNSKVASTHKLRQIQIINESKGET